MFCGFASNLEVDHVVERWKGGEVYNAENCRVLCTKCHIARHKRVLSPGEARMGEAHFREDLGLPRQFTCNFEASATLFCNFNSKVFAIWSIDSR